MRLFAALALVVGALAAWAASLHSIPTRGLGVYGLPPVLPPGWYVAFAVLTCGAVAVIWAQRPSVALISLYILALVVVLYATVPAITDVPHYAWVYKHIGVTRFVEVNHGLDFAAGDIYNRWPGLFAVAATFSRVASVDPLVYAAWAEPFFAAIETLLVGAVALAIGRDVRVAGYAALLFAIGNWLGQSYFAPQAVALVLSLALLLAVVRMCSGGEVRPRLMRLPERLTRRPQPSVELADPLPWRHATAVVVVLGLNVVIVATHQLTPYLLLAQVGGLTALGIVRPRWLVVAMGAITAAYLAANFDYVARSSVGLFTGLNPLRNARPLDATPAQLDWFDANAGMLLSVSEFGLMSLAAVRLALLGQATKALSLIVLAVAPFLILFAQSYGGEAALRSILFSAPWSVVLIALGVQTIRRPKLRMAAALAIALAIAYMFIPAFYGAEDRNIIPKGEVQASEYYNAHVHANSVLMLAAPDFPTRFGATYNLEDGPNLVGTSEFQDRMLGPRNIQAVIDRIHVYSRNGYLVFSTTGYEYAKVHQLTPPGALQGLEHAVATSPRFRAWYFTQDARIYQLIG